MPPTILTFVQQLTPVTVMVLEVTTAPRATLVWGVKLNASGVVSTAIVVALNAALTPPMVSVTVLVWLNRLGEYCHNFTVSPLLTVPGTFVRVPPLIS